MARRSDIDWEQVERLYVAGHLTIRQIADECGIAPSAVTRKAKAQNWARDLSAAIEARTKAKVSAIDVSALVEQSAQQSAQKSAQTIRDAIEQASDVAAGVVIKHRASLRLDSERAGIIEALFDEHMSRAESVRDMATVAQTFKLLVDAKAKVRDQERVVYGLDKDKPADTGLSGESVATLKRLKAALEDAGED